MAAETQVAKTYPIAIPETEIADFCRKNHIRRLSLFGSIIHDDFRPESDVDVLVEFEPGRTPGWEFFAMQEELAGIFGRKVDLNTIECLSKYFRDEVAREAELLYEVK